MQRIIDRHIMQEIQQKEIPIVKELVRIVVTYFDSRKGQNKISKKTIQKILYRARNALPEDSAIRSAIPFYWYLNGPYCEDIDHAIATMKKEGVLLAADGKYELYSLNPDYKRERFVDHGDFQLEDIRKRIADEVGNMRGFSNLQLVKEIYDESPILFYPSYKDMFFKYFESFCNCYLQHDEKKRFVEKDILNYLEMAFVSLPPEPLFNDFKITFLKFKQATELVVNYKRKDDPEYIAILEKLKELAGDVWKTFAHGARILKHDPPYEDRISQWNEMFESKTSALASAANEISKIIHDTLEPPRARTTGQSSEDKKFKIQLAKSIGLDSLPEYDPEAFDRLSCIIASKIGTEGFDSVEEIKEIRIREVD